MRKFAPGREKECAREIRKKREGNERGIVVKLDVWWFGFAPIAACVTFIFTISRTSHRIFFCSEAFVVYCQEVFEIPHAVSVYGFVNHTNGRTVDTRARKQPQNLLYVIK